ncbi:MAG TPA: GLPGLI family protein, partial [Candidatus Coprenecus merdigallinarum]|nr:GLPGLI family protein [Candidatus Coprenecus merdigallinarum]
GYNCQRATGTFRGREWQVWFTYDIPYNYGPWKLGGLPGLILKAEDSSGTFVWEAVSLIRPEGCPIYRHSGDVSPGNGADRHQIRKSSRKNTNKMLEASWKLPFYMSGSSQTLYFNDEKVDTRSISSGRTWYPRLELE